MTRTRRFISLRASALLAASLAGTTWGCAPNHPPAPAPEPQSRAGTATPATTRAVPVVPPPTTATAPTTAAATAPSDHHAAPPRRTGP